MPVINLTTSTADDADSSPSATRRFGRVPARWLEDPDIGVDELAVLAALAVHAGRDGVCVVRQRVLAGLLQRSREWVCRVLARLCQPGGFVEKEHRADRDGWNLACRYRLPDLASCEDGSAGIPADYPGDPESDLSGMGTDGAACDPAPLGPATPALGDPVAPAPAGVIASVPADMTGRAHHEQTSLNRESSSAAPRCAACHCRGPLGGLDAADGGADRSRLVPADWQPDVGDLAWLTQHRPDLDAMHMTAIFVCGSRARALRYADPSAAWRRWALAERTSGRRPTASAEPPHGFPAPPRPAPSVHHAAQEARNAATGRAVLAHMMARRADGSSSRVGG
jgi:hypothetical protein